MNTADDGTPIAEIHVEKIQSLWPHFKAETIAQSLGRWPIVVEETIIALKAAISSSSLPCEEHPFPEAPPSKIRNSFELLRGHLPRTQLWERLGFTSRQLDSIRLAFMAAVSLQEERANATESKVWQLQREGQIEREAYNMTRTRHLR